MDNKKTGALIAQRRQELGLTQKELGDRLHVSDRAVSKWERAAGFPDVSLLELLADALDVSVLELIRGERLAAEEQPSFETERSARTAVRELGARLQQRMRRYRRLVIVLTVLLITGGAVLAYQRFGPFRIYAVKEREVSAAEALEAMPHVLITVYDFAASQRLLNSPEVGGLLIPALPDSEGTLPSNVMDYYVAVDDEAAAPYKELLRIDGQAADGISIEVFYNVIVVSYFRENRHCILEVFYGGPIRKSAYIDKYLTSGPKVDGIVASNENNERFTISWEEWRPMKN